MLNKAIRRPFATFRRERVNGLDSKCCAVIGAQWGDEGNIFLRAIHQMRTKQNQSKERESWWICSWLIMISVPDIMVEPMQAILLKLVAVNTCSICCRVECYTLNARISWETELLSTSRPCLRNLNNLMMQRFRLKADFSSATGKVLCKACIKKCDKIGRR